ncbi:MULTISPECIES: hypothetical protein [unclassified Dietzia]|uniref:hypothetical protein n=1 Tax=unclassified Dietzia TaxID=2617939 RepID=UPI000D2067D8|nr:MULTISPECIES: hypothetical protein [unclassified Dietzia]AVZ39840.1 hypothetical protein CT688_10575 [Dietzia sp. JS16-p6b]QGW25208.1 hypothetical protein GJR88_03366 [Dietzia sp. DQ12-45-1b]
MTTTLLKHEWLRTRGALGTTLGMITLIGVLGSLLGAAGWPLLSQFGMALGVLAAIVAVPAVQLTLAADYWRTGYGRTGYFTHSIPVRGSTIFWVRLAWAMIASLAALVLTAGLALLAWWAAALHSGITSPSSSVLSDTWTTVTTAAPPWMIAAGLIVGLSSFLIWPVYYYFAVSVGHERRLAALGAGGPVVVFVVIYVATQVLSLLAMIALPFGVAMGAGNTLEFVRVDVLGELAAGAAAQNDVMPVGFLAASAVLAVYCLWRTARSWDHKVALV